MTRAIILGGWVLVGLLLVTCEVLSIATHRGYAGIAWVLERATSSRLGLILFFLGWMWLGWHFFAR
jgi:hypothetical protein